jgi:hypothetical protein
MGFYYLSVSSVLLLAAIYVVLALVFRGLVSLTREMPGRRVLLAVVGVVFLVAPVAEELWIAWHFGQACKQAGTFIYRKVQVEGFYDDTGVSLELVRSGPYRFVEGRSDKGVIRVSKGDPEFMNDALQRFRQENHGKDPSVQDVVRVKVGEKTEALVYPKRGDSWRIVYLDRPTARYHYKRADPMNGTRMSHKVGRSGTLVLDSATNDVIARYTSFGREPPWFWIGLGAAPYACDAPGRWPNTSGNALVYRESLVPVTKP